MISFSLEQIVAATGGTLLLPDDGGPAAGGSRTDAVVTSSVVIDSRAVEPGSLFVALVGEHADGHDYVTGAIARGAATALVSRPVPGAKAPLVLVPDVQLALGDVARAALARLRDAGDVRVAAITGSVGKTSTKDLLAQLLAPMGNVVAPAGSFNNEIGLPLTVLTADEDTRVLVLEMGADAPGNLTYLTSIAPPDVAVVLAVGTAHLDGFGSVEKIAATKAELIQGLKPSGVAVLNADDDRVAAMAPLAAGERVVRYSRADPTAEVRAEGVVLDDQARASFTLAVGAQSAQVRLAVVGSHHVANALAAAAAATELGLPFAQVAAGLSTATATSPHRMQVLDTAAGVTVIDDSYNANPNSMRAGLAALATIAGARRRSVAVLGEMLELGAASHAEHTELGRVAVTHGVDRIVVVGRGAVGIHEGAVAAGAADAVFVESVEDAAGVLAGELRAGDVVLVKSSKGAHLTTLAEHLTSGVAL